MLQSTTAKSLNSKTMNPKHYREAGREGVGVGEGENQTKNKRERRGQGDLEGK